MGHQQLTSTTPRELGGNGGFLPSLSQTQNKTKTIIKRLAVATCQRLWESSRREVEFELRVDFICIMTLFYFVLFF